MIYEIKFLDDEHVILKDHISGKGCNLPINELLMSLNDGTPNNIDTILQDMLQVSVEYDQEHLRLLNKWIENDWLGSLLFFLESNRVACVDIGENAKQNRQKTINEYYGNVSNIPTDNITFTKEISLNDNHLKSGRNISSILFKRRTKRRFSSAVMPFIEFEKIIVSGFNRIKKTRLAAKQSSIGLLMSYGAAFDFYIAIYSVDGIEPGIYQYKPESNVLGLLHSGNFRNDISNILAQQVAPLNSCMTIFFISNFNDYQFRYRHERALRNLYIEAGRIAQHLVISSEAMKYRTFVTPAINDQMAAQLFQLKDSSIQQALYSITIGK